MVTYPGIAWQNGLDPAFMSCACVAGANSAVAQSISTSYIYKPERLGHHMYAVTTCRRAHAGPKSHRNSKAQQTSAYSSQMSQRCEAQQSIHRPNTWQRHDLPSHSRTQSGIHCVSAFKTKLNQTIPVGRPIGADHEGSMPQAVCMRIGIATSHKQT